MKSSNAIVLTLALSGGLVTACGDHSMAAAPPPTVTVQMLDTAQVLSLAQKPSETADPFVVVAGNLVMTDTSENSEPININAT